MESEVRTPTIAPSSGSGGIVSNPQGDPFNNPLNINPWDPSYRGVSPYAPGEPFFHDGHWWFQDADGYWWFQGTGGDWWWWDGNQWNPSGISNDENNPQLDSTTGNNNNDSAYDPNNWKPAFLQQYGRDYQIEGYTEEGYLIVRTPNGGIQIIKPYWREGYPNWQDFPEHMWPDIRPRWGFNTIDHIYDPYNDPNHPDYIDPDQYGGYQDENGNWQWNNPGVFDNPIDPNSVRNTVPGSTRRKPTGWGAGG